MRCTCREFRGPEQHRSQLQRIFQLERVNHTAKREFLISDKQCQTDAGKKVVEFSITSSKTRPQITLQKLRHGARAEQLVDSFMCDEVTSLRVLIGHQLIFRRVDQEKDHANVFGEHLFLQLRKLNRGHSGSTRILFLYGENVFGNRSPDHFANTPISRVVENEDVLDAAVQNSLYAPQRLVDLGRS